MKLFRRSLTHFIWVTVNWKYLDVFSVVEWIWFPIYNVLICIQIFKKFTNPLLPLQKKKHPESFFFSGQPVSKVERAAKHHPFLEVLCFYGQKRKRSSRMAWGLRWLVRWSFRFHLDEMGHNFAKKMDGRDLKKMITSTNHKHAKSQRVG